MELQVVTVKGKEKWFFSLDFMADTNLAYKYGEYPWQEPTE
ncbi:hypothetical protein [Butyrivibrio sp.]|nr:hypothetical protein [Butyrivibrio sp.]